MKKGRIPRADYRGQVDHYQALRFRWKVGSM